MRKMYILDGNRGHWPASRYSLMMMQLSCQLNKQKDCSCIMCISTDQYYETEEKFLHTNAENS